METAGLDRIIRLDFHAHTRWSDGLATFVELVGVAKDSGLEVIAVTDHDTTDSWSPKTIQENRELLKQGGLEYGGHNTLVSGNLKIVQGIEFSTYMDNIGLHILGLFTRQPTDELRKYFDKVSLYMMERAQKIVEKLNNQGIQIRWEEVLSQVSEGKRASRLHIGYVLYSMGYGNNPVEARELFLKNDQPAYEPFDYKRVEPAEEVIRIIKKEMGGVAVLAHPHEHLSGKPDPIRIMRKLKEAEIDGVEFGVDYYNELAKSMGLGFSWGSDFHGLKYKPNNPLGKVITYGDMDTMMIPPLRERLLTTLNM